MAEDPLDTLERQVRQLTREVTDLTRQVAHEQKMRGFLEDRVQRLESSVHHKMSRSEVIQLGLGAGPAHRRRGPAHQPGGRHPDARALTTHQRPRPSP